MALILASILDPLLLLCLAYVLIKKLEPVNAALIGCGLFVVHLIIASINPAGVLPIVFVKIIINPGVLFLAAQIRKKIQG